MHLTQKDKAVAERTDPTSSGFSRRTFIANASALSAASLLGVSRPLAAEPPPEVKKIRLVHTTAICLSPQYIAEELLRLEGFSTIEYVDTPVAKGLTLVEAGRADMTMGAAPDVVAALDAGRAVVPLAGIHAGCYELFVNGRIAAIKDLKGRSVVITTEDSTERLFVSSIVAYVGVNPRDIQWITTSSAADAMQRFSEGKADAFLAFAPQPQELRAKKVGRVVLNTTHDRPWSQYFCCMFNARHEFVERYPVATRRALRAILKAADLCAREPERAARFLVAKGYEPRYDLALEVLKDLPYRRWRDADPEDTLRFHALRLHEVGIIQSSPQKLLAQRADWRFLNELRRELKT
jgi:NitT/TauT family transport system substrate-binding protein